MCSIRKGFLRNFTKFAGKHLRQSLLFTTVAGLVLVQHFFTEHLWMTASDNTIRMYSQKTNPTITILKFLVYKIQIDIVKPKMFTRFNFKTKPYSQAL